MVYAAVDPGKLSAYRFLAEFVSSREAYEYAGYMHGKLEYKKMHLILESVVRTEKIARPDGIREIFTPEGKVIKNG